ncbi:hypothetical protein CEN44_24415, partial [Fischerella muscicola CCMEE 5323]
MGRWVTRGPHSPKGVGIRGGGEMGRKQFKIQNLGRGCGECKECVDATTVRGSQSWTPRDATCYNC